MNRLFLLRDAQHGMAVAPVHSIDDPLALLRGEVAPKEPMVFRHNVGRVPSDLMMGGDVCLLLISRRVRDVLRTESFSGWATYPVEVRRKRGEEIPGYFGLAITGRSTESGLTVAGTDDLFLSGGSAAIVVTARVRDALRAAGATNASYLPVA